MSPFPSVTGNLHFVKNPFSGSRLTADTAYELYKARAELATTDVKPLVLSCVVSFVSALLATKLLLRIVSKYSFASFAWYRIAFGAVILITAYTGLVRW